MKDNRTKITISIYIDYSSLAQGQSNGNPEIIELTMACSTSLPTTTVLWLPLKKIFIQFVTAIMTFSEDQKCVYSITVIEAENVINHQFDFQLTQLHSLCTYALGERNKSISQRINSFIISIFSLLVTCASHFSSCWCWKTSSDALVALDQ